MVFQIVNFVYAHVYRLELETFVSELSAMREYAEQNILKAKSLLRNADPDLKLDLPLPDHISSECGLSRTGISILDKCLSEQFPVSLQCTSLEVYFIGSVFL